MELMELIEIGN